MRKSEIRVVMEMSWLGRFVQTVLHALNPKQYHHLAGLPLKSAFGYFFALILAVFILMSVLWIPALFSLPDTISREFGKFNDLSVEIIYDQNEPVVLTKEFPLVTIDMKNSYDGINDGLVLISKDATFYRFLPYGGSGKISDSQNLLENKDELGRFLAVLAFMAVPMILAYAYVYFAVKYIVIVVLVALVGFVIARVVKFEIRFSDTMRAGLFAATPMVLIGMLTKPFIPSVGFLDYLAFIIYFILGCLVLGEFETVPNQKEKTATIHLDGEKREKHGERYDRRREITETQSTGKRSA